jgi:hypothetical protein
VQLDPLEKKEILVKLELLELRDQKAIKVIPVQLVLLVQLVIKEMMV